MQRSVWLQQFIDVYSGLSTDNLSTLESVYHPDVTFVDPLHKVEGFPALLRSFQTSYQNLLQCDFIIDHVFEANQEAAVYWRMNFRHKSLNSANPITVTGHSQLRARDNKVVFHRDYLDVGAMIYEHVPLLGRLIKTIKQRASNA
jgi:hypothetical protein